MILSSKQPSTQWALLNKVISIRVMRITQIKKLHPSEEKIVKLSGIIHNGFLGTGLIVHEIVSPLKGEPAFPINSLWPFYPDMGSDFAFSTPPTRCLWIECMLGLHSIIFKAKEWRCLPKSVPYSTIYTKKLACWMVELQDEENHFYAENPIHRLLNSHNATTLIVWLTLGL